MSNIMNDVSVLTTIPEKTLSKLTDKIMYCICSAIQEDMIQEKEISELDLGIGILYVKNTPEGPKYKFVPSDILSKSVENTFKNKLNLLEDVLADSLGKKFTNIYKDLC